MIGLKLKTLIVSVPIYMVLGLIALILNFVFFMIFELIFIGDSMVGTLHPLAIAIVYIIVGPFALLGLSVLVWFKKSRFTSHSIILFVLLLVVPFFYLITNFANLGSEQYLFGFSLLSNKYLTIFGYLYVLITGLLVALFQILAASAAIKLAQLLVKRFTKNNRKA
ncbi:hypothetical protein [uncultured Oceanicoccus sp.]|uniref:hypothetical protein n=1 Tax=uncultured Oceanicoccus sp. TaxID=1706381 RepID=UPI0030D6FF6D